MDHPNKTDFRSLFQDFYTVTGIRTGICDLNYNSLINVHAEDLCHYIHTACPDTYDVCVQCDKWAIQKCLQTKKGFLFRCPFGLIEYGTPLYSNETIIGYASTGMMTDGSPEEQRHLSELAEHLGLDYETAMRYYRMQPHHTKEELSAICSIFETCVSHIYYRDSIQLKEIGIIQDISDYISKHLTDNISVMDLCRQFGLSKADLYAIIQNRENCGVAEYVKSIRLKVAEKFIRTTRLPVTEVADQTGFDNYSYFTKVFKARYGLTPRDYRKRHYQQNKVDTLRTFDILTADTRSIPLYNCFDE